MLPLTLAFAKCDDEKYWYEETGSCIKVTECTALKLVAYNFWL